MNTIYLVKRFFLALTIVFFVSCDTDFTEIGANVVDGDIHNSLIRLEAPIVAYDKATGAVQSNNLTVNTLGVYNNPVFGKTTASYVTQVQLASANLNPTFVSPVLDSVYIYIPYTSTLTASATTNSTAKYTLSGVYGDTLNYFKLDIKRNNFYLRDSDASSGGTAGQKYYSDDRDAIVGSPGESILEGGQVQQFRYSAGVVKREFRYTPETEGATEIGGRETLAPGMYFPLKKSTFETLIFAAGGTGNLLNNSVFTNYFRGIYFDVEQNGEGVMGTPDFTKGVITMKYRDSVITTTSRTQVKKTLTLNLTGNRINFFTNDYRSDFTSAIATSDAVLGDNRLYVKGGEGSMALLDIKNSTIDSLRNIAATGERVLVNEANLVFYVDQVKMQPVQDIYAANNARVEEPIRIFLYDVNNKRPLYDYYTDGTTVTSNTKYSKYVHGGLLERSSGRGTQYKIRITDHINNLINKDSTNVKLGLVVTEDINTITSAALKNPFENEPWMGAVLPVQPFVRVSTLPTASVMHEFGTVLYGNNIPAGDPDYDKRLKLEIFYTKPE
ncbi:DUF4270 domain-containing protein [Flavobacterium rivuli]|uniref:DUF4270 domain-containing protein n=1 Tax=Flavobacterium rivuli TaxID=498301 RepID=UPI0003821C4B|nr:DUF4270 domain-containing protein [Flavobacterium rivuli]